EVGAPSPRPRGGDAAVGSTRLLGRPESGRLAPPGARGRLRHRARGKAILPAVRRGMDATTPRPASTVLTPRAPEPRVAARRPARTGARQSRRQRLALARPRPVSPAPPP